MAWDLRCSVLTRERYLVFVADSLISFRARGKPCTVSDLLYGMYVAVFQVFTGSQTLHESLSH